MHHLSKTFRFWCILYYLKNFTRSQESSSATNNLCPQVFNLLKTPTNLRNSTSKFDIDKKSFYIRNLYNRVSIDFGVSNLISNQTQILVAVPGLNVTKGQNVCRDIAEDSSDSQNLISYYFWDYRQSSTNNSKIFLSPVEKISIELRFLVTDTSKPLQITVALSNDIKPGGPAIDFNSQNSIIFRSELMIDRFYSIWNKADPILFFPRIISNVYSDEQSYVSSESRDFSLFGEKCFRAVELGFYDVGENLRTNIDLVSGEVVEQSTDDDDDSIFRSWV